MQSALWAALRALGIRTAIHGFGRLFGPGADGGPVHSAPATE